MADLTLAELEATAAEYEKRLVPPVFGIWTGDMLQAARVAQGQRVLDVACGTGVLARAMAERVGPGGSVAGLDINPGMLAVARKIAPQVDWRPGEARSLPFEDGAFDAAASQFGFMFFPDRAAALKEMRRVVAPSGQIAVAVFDGLECNDAYARLAGVFEDHVGKGAGEALRMPFAMGDIETLVSIFDEVGFRGVETTTKVRRERYASVREIVLSDVKGWFPLAGIRVDDATMDAVVAQATNALAPYLDGEGAVDFPVSAHIVSGRKD